MPSAVSDDPRSTGRRRRNLTGGPAQLVPRVFGMRSDDVSRISRRIPRRHRSRWPEEACPSAVTQRRIGRCFAGRSPRQDCLHCGPVARPGVEARNVARARSIQGRDSKPRPAGCERELPRSLDSADNDPAPRIVGQSSSRHASDAVVLAAVGPRATRAREDTRARGQGELPHDLVHEARASMARPPTARRRSRSAPEALPRCSRTESVARPIAADWPSATDWRESRIGRIRGSPAAYGDPPAPGDAVLARAQRAKRSRNLTLVAMRALGEARRP